jgi:hypothetical protein
MHNSCGEGFEELQMAKTRFKPLRRLRVQESLEGLFHLLLEFQIACTFVLLGHEAYNIPPTETIAAKVKRRRVPFDVRPSGTGSSFARSLKSRRTVRGSNVYSHQISVALKNRNI